MTRGRMRLLTVCFCVVAIPIHLANSACPKKCKAARWWAWQSQNCGGGVGCSFGDAYEVSHCVDGAFTSNGGNELCVETTVMLGWKTGAPATSACPNDWDDYSDAVNVQNLPVDWQGQTNWWWCEEDG
jgi:hypothetical protein